MIEPKAGNTGYTLEQALVEPFSTGQNGICLYQTPNSKQESNTFIGFVLGGAQEWRVVLKQDL